uniref:Uncharacterized protein n=1 Tax=Rhodnius prolixus TaxID=13249 RepID=T1HM38_RHOPR
MFKLQEEESASIQPSMSVFHVQPASLSQGYETTLPHDHGADPNARDSIGNTPLHLAACTNHINVVLLLLKAANSIDHLGQSPLQLARSKLKILQRSKIPDAEIKAQVSQVIEMLLYFEKLGASKSIESVDTELLTRFQDQLKTVDSREQ